MFDHKERLCGVLVGENKNFVKPAAHLTTPIFQHQLISFAKKVGLIKMDPSEDDPDWFKSDDYPGIVFLPHPQRHPQRCRLNGLYLTQLRRHYETNERLMANHPDLLNINPEILKFVRCRDDRTKYQSKEYSADAARLNYLVCVEMEVDLNENFSYAVRQERMAKRTFYIEIEFFAVHEFRGKKNMLIFNKFHKVDISKGHGLIEDKGERALGRQDVGVLSYLCGRIQGDGGKVYILEGADALEERLRDALA
jgi:hypothetical protein